MSIDKGVDSTVLDGYFSDIADAIRGKNGSSNTYTPAQMPTAIDNIPIGGLDIPTFTVTLDANEDVVSISCNKTYQQCVSDYYVASFASAEFIYTDEHGDVDHTVLLGAEVTDKQSYSIYYSVVTEVNNHEKVIAKISMSSSNTASVRMLNLPIIMSVGLQYDDIDEVWIPDKTCAEIREAQLSGYAIAVYIEGNYASDDYECVGYWDELSRILWYSVCERGTISVYGDSITVTVYEWQNDIVTKNYETVYQLPPTMQTKTVTPTESAQTITPDVGYDGLDEVDVGAISSSYIGSGITQRSSSDLTASGATVSVPSGYYASNASKAVANGTAGTPTATKGTVSNHSVSVTPSVTNTTGYITGGTKTGTAVSVSAGELVSGTYTVDSSGTKDVTNYANVSVPAGTAGSPALTVDAVQNHSKTIRSSVINSTGWITGGTKSGASTVVSASDLVSGSETKTENGTYDVTNLSSLVVSLTFSTITVSSSSPTGGSNGDVWIQT